MSSTEYGLISIICVGFFYILLIYFLERREQIEKERERNSDIWLPFPAPKWSPGPI